MQPSAGPSRSTTPSPIEQSGFSSSPYDPATQAKHFQGFCNRALCVAHGLPDGEPMNRRVIEAERKIRDIRKNRPSLGLLIGTYLIFETGAGKKGRLLASYTIAPDPQDVRTIALPEFFLGNLFFIKDPPLGLPTAVLTDIVLRGQQAARQGHPWKMGLWISNKAFADTLDSDKFLALGAPVMTQTYGQAQLYIAHFETPVIKEAQR